MLALVARRLVCALVMAWLLGAALVGLFVWAASHRERLEAEEADRRIDAAEASRREHLAQLRAHEDELACFRSVP